MSGGRTGRCSEPLCTTTTAHHTHTDADGRSWCCGTYPYDTAVAARPAGGDKARPCPSPVCDYPDHGWRPSAPSSPVPDDVREEIARAIYERGRADNGAGSTARAEMLADAVLATPALRRALAERDEARAAVERVRTLADKLGAEAMTKVRIERATAALRIYDALRGERYALEDVAREFGVDLDAEDGETP